MSYNTYENYKDSKVKWLKEIPNEWNISKVKHCFIRKNKKANQEDPIVLSLARDGVKIRDISTGEGQIAESYYHYNPVEPFDLLLNPMDLTSGANCNMSEVEGVISPAYVNLKAKTGINPKYYDYYFKLQYWSMAFFVHGKGVSIENRWTLNNETLMDYKLPVPNEDTQNKIVSYLNFKLNEIDDNISKNKELISLLEEKKVALINQCVTKGLNPNVPMKDSGIEWIGEIPEHWRNGRIKHILDYSKYYPIGDGDHGSIKPEMYLDEGVPYLRVQNLTWGFDINYENLVYISEEVNTNNKKSILKPKDILIAKTGATIGKMAIIPQDMNQANTTSSVGKITINHNKYDYMYFAYLLSSYIIQYQIWHAALQKSAQPGFNIDDLIDFKILIPSLDEQLIISNYLNENVFKIDKTIEKVQSQIDLLEEYKQSLIYHVVTGKVDVSEVEV